MENGKFGEGTVQEALGGHFSVAPLNCHSNTATIKEAPLNLVSHTPTNQIFTGQIQALCWLNQVWGPQVANPPILDF